MTSLNRAISTTTRWTLDGGVICIRQKLERPPSDPQISKKQSFGFATWGNSGALTVVTKLTSRQWFTAKRLKKPEMIDGHEMRFRVYVVHGDLTPENLEEIYHFTKWPHQFKALRGETAKLEQLCKCVRDKNLSEQSEAHSTANAQHKEKLAKSPLRLGHEKNAMDHYKNQRDVLTSLLKKQWPHVADALDKHAAAKTESDKVERKTEVWLSFIADYRALTGRHPEVKEQDEVWRHDYFASVMSEALKATRGGIDKVNWQLTIGWIEKNYYRMGETDLEAAFKRDWDYSRTIKGNTLKQRAKRIGLSSALKMGRPERPSDLP